ncbi:hypothetical protein ACWD26_05070 [Streptomyces sp. NPDC002787]
MVVILDALAAVSATKAALTELDKLLSRIKQAEQRFLDIPFGIVAAAMEAYQETVLPDGYARKLAAEETAEVILGPCRQQGSAIEVVRAAIVTVQRDIERRTKR